MLSRNENGKLRLKDFTLSVVLDDLFEQCKTIDESNWLYGELRCGIYASCNTRNEQLDNDAGEIIEKEVCKNCNRLSKWYVEGHYCTKDGKYLGVIKDIETEFCNMWGKVIK